MKHYPERTGKIGVLQDGLFDDDYTTQIAVFD